MSAFKLLAIRPLKGCHKRFLKNLTADQLYSFYNSYTYYSAPDVPIKKPTDGPVAIIGSDIKFPVSIYNRESADKHPLAISISAVAGKNGTGKSSLVELFFAVIYLYSVHHQILKPNVSSLKLSTTELDAEHGDLNDRQKQIIAKRNAIIKKLNGDKSRITIDRFEALKKEMQALFQQEAQLKKLRENIIEKRKSNSQKIIEIEAFTRDIKVSIYFEDDGAFYSLQLDYDKENDKTQHIIKRISGVNEQDYQPFEVQPRPEELAKHFFYTIAVNYSHYALNSLVIGEWINSLFHKNDGYTTPVVINPMRTEGNFNINSEMNFARYRLLSNKLQAYNKSNKQEEEKIPITENHYINKAVFTLNRSKTDALPRKVRFPKKGLTGNPREINLLNTFLAEYLDASEQLELHNKEFPLKEIICNYIINKVDTIPRKYPWFGQVYQFGSNIPFLENEKLFRLLKHDGSHVTYKLKQAVHFLKYNLSDSPIEFQVKKGQLENNTKIRFELTLSEIMDYMGGVSGREIMPLLPPSIFDIDFEVANEAGSTSLFTGLSSGEQQLVHTVQAVIYHLNNLQSVHFGVSTRARYHSVNIVYDEIELYFHPDYQRRFVADLLSEFERFYVGDQDGIRSINIILLTHSPFILSDIPAENILLLERDNKSKRTVPRVVASETFAANINDLIADGFFLTGTLMGQLAENQIRQSIDRIKENKATPEDKEVLDKVGDTFLRASLQNFKKRHNG